MFYGNEAERDKHRAWTKGLKVGDTVAIRSSGLGGDYVYNFEKVIKITKQHGGTIFVDRKSYDMDGDERGRSAGGGFYSRWQLVEPTQEIQDAQEHNELRYDVTYAWRNGELAKRMSLPALRLIASIIDQYPEEKKS